MVDEDASHLARRRREEVRPAAPRDVALRGEPHVGLVYERGRLQAVGGALPPQLAPGDPPQLVGEDVQALNGQALPLVPAFYAYSY
jgi:hypothetical protein